MITISNLLISSVKMPQHEQQLHGIKKEDWASKTSFKKKNDNEH